MEKDTLDYHESRPGVQRVSMADVSVSDAAAATRGFLDQDPEEGNVYPESSALNFYLMNHAYADLKSRVGMYEPLGELQWVADEYHRVLSDEGLRLFYYLLLICTREIRHTTNVGDAEKTYMNKVASDEDKAFAPHVFSYIGTWLKGESSSGAVNKFKQKPPDDLPLGVYTKILAWTFHNAKYSGGFGGPPWGQVADCLNNMVHGTFSVEMMLDTGFTLAHNNGPIFNKGMLYNNYDAGQIIKILDCQRAGQVPQLIANQEVNRIQPVHLERQETVAGLLGGEFTGHVNWFLVEALGSQGSYKAEKDHQKKTYGIPEDTQKKMDEAEKAKIKAQEEADKKKAEEEKNTLEVMPGQKVHKISRKEIA